MASGSIAQRVLRECFTRQRLLTCTCARGALRSRLGSICVLGALSFAGILHQTSDKCASLAVIHSGSFAAVVNNIGMDAALDNECSTPVATTRLFAKRCGSLACLCSDSHMAAKARRDEVRTLLLAAQSGNTHIAANSRSKDAWRHA